MTDEDKIKELVSWFFDKINRPIIEGLYIGNEQNWDALCAALTILGDLQRAKKEYLALQEINHLECIGIMQTIYIEQDCVLTFRNSILECKDNGPLSNYESIRSFRNEAFGHPSERGKKGMKGLFTRHFFDIVDNKKQILKIINWECTGKINSEHVSLLKLVTDNSKITISYLTEIKDSFIKKIEKTMNEYKIKISDLFNGASYTFEKLLTKEHDKIAIDTYYAIEEDIAKAKEALIERNVFNDHQREIEVVSFFSDKLKVLFYVQTYLDVEFYAYAISLRRELEKLKKTLKEIEGVFSSRRSANSQYESKEGDSSTITFK